jgi:hypothetical protein
MAGSISELGKRTIVHLKRLEKLDIEVNSARKCSAQLPKEFNSRASLSARVRSFGPPVTRRRRWLSNWGKPIVKAGSL